MRIQPKPFLSFLFNPLGKHARSLEYHASELFIDARRDREIHLRSVVAPLVINKGRFRSLLGTTIRIQIDDGSEVALKGANYDQALIFSRKVRDAWVDFNVGAFERQREEIDVILQALDELKQPTRYPAACVLLPTLGKAHTLEKTLFSKLPSEAIGTANFGQVQKIRGFIQSAQSCREQAISQFEKKELERWQEFFDTIEKNPLTPEQRLSIVTDEDATLVLAGAGSGKTSVIAAKAAYLLKAGIRKPEEILLLAYAKAAAAEMTERIKSCSSEPLKALTFHGLGTSIIGYVEGNKPALAAHATDDKQFHALIKEILKTLVATVPEVSKSIIGWFSYARLEEKSEWDFQKKCDYYTFIEKVDLRTLQGEQVKSFEELIIANWLYENGIEYEYEPDYEHHIPSTGKRNYCPDFRLKESGVYIEHFGVRREKAENGSDHFTTAPYIDLDEYLAGMDWKREVHTSHGTTLIETFSYEREEGRLLEALAKKIWLFSALLSEKRC